MVDIFTQYYDTNLGEDVINFLKKCNVNIEVVYFNNSVVAMISHGLLNEAKQELGQLALKLNKINKDDLVIGIEPSEVLVWRDEAINLIGDETPSVLLFEELVLKLQQLDALPELNTLNNKVWVYEHCHQKSLAETSNLIKALELIPELQTEIINGGCCGMAGEFGYKYAEISENIAHNSLDSYIEKIRGQDRLLATGTSCRKQILDIFKIQSTYLPRLFVESVKGKRIKKC
jgi:Fe-S oxidoreductase